MNINLCYFRYFCLSLFLMISHSLWAEDNTAADTKIDPALQAIEALKPVETEPESPELPANNVEGMESAATVDAMPEQLEAVTVEPEPPQNLPPAKDVILVLDNSGSMKKNDPQFLASKAVNEFIKSLDTESRVGIIIFDQNVHVVMPLTQVNDQTREEILNSLKQINYKGQFTDSPAAIERAIYDLKNSGRHDAKKLIIFMTDGIVDTGNADQDLEKAKWLKQDLAPDAADSEIQIFGIAFTEEADFQLIQSLSRQTQGEYYRALAPEDLESVFSEVYEIINKLPEPEPVVIPEAQPEPEKTEIAPPPQPVIIEVPVQPSKMDEEEELRSMMILVALAVLIIAVIIMVLMLVRGSRKKDGEDEYAQEAYLNDTNSYTSQATYKLGTKPVMLGRVAGTDTEHLNYIVIPQTTIGRRHALIEYKDFAYWIIDQGSINGTFVNDHLISSETRLKHGDRIRLHKYEFEFVMPEMVDAGMTVISNTVMAGSPAAVPSEETTMARGGAIVMEDTEMPEPDFDLTGSGSHETNTDEEDTVMRASTSKKKEEGTPDETIMLGNEGETVSEEDEDATIRPEFVEDDEDAEDLTIDGFTDDDDKK